MLLNRKAFTLVEMLVALAVSSIVIIATYASYDMVKTQYEKNIDVADMHTSGRAIMRMIERDIRMAGYEHRSSSGNKTFSTGIANQLVLSESNDACCDGVSVVYDHHTDDSDGSERRRITYSVEAFPGTETLSYKLLGSDTTRYRLYKRVDILGRDGVILATEESGTDQVLADFVDDLQFYNIGYAGTLFISTGTDIYTYSLSDKRITARYFVASSSNPLTDIVYDNRSDKERLYSSVWRRNIIYVRSLQDDGDLKFNDPRTVEYSIDSLPYHSESVLFDAGYVYSCNDDSESLGVVRYNADSGTRDSGIVFTDSWCQDLVADNNFLYVLVGSDVKVFDKSIGSLVTTISGVLGASSITIDKEKEYLYVGSATTNDIKRINISTRVSNIIDFPSSEWEEGVNDLKIGPNGNLYIAPYIRDPARRRIYETRSITVLNPLTGDIIERIPPVEMNKRYRIAFRGIESGKASLVNIKLTLRSKNKQHPENKTYTKVVNEEHHVGNYNFEFNDKYKRDVFFSTVAVRNMLL